MSERIDTKTSKTERLFRLFLKLCEDRRGLIPYSEFEDEEQWGDTRTFRRLKDDLNILWEHYKQKPFFKVVDIDGKETDRGERFFKLNHDSVEGMHAERLAVFPAYLELMRVVGGTILEDEMKPIYEKISLSLGRSDKQYLKKMEKKFYYFGKGMKSYKNKTEVLDEVYDALIKERLLNIKFETESGTKQERVKPLSLIMFNSGLYLCALYEKQKSANDMRTFRIEGILEAKSVRSSKFDYPVSFDPKKVFGGQFGLIYGKDNDKYAVELHFANDPWVKRYVKDRQWTNSDIFSETPTGELILQMKVSDLTEVISFVLSFGDKVKVVQPDALKREVVETIDKLKQLYSA